MKNYVLGSCPVCSHKLQVTRLQCSRCKSAVEGEFELDKFTYLSKEEKYFVEIFIKNRGNIKEIEKDLGISYPTVRRNLNQVIETLGYNVKDEKEVLDKKEILDKLSNGDISSEEALALLKNK